MPPTNPIRLFWLYCPDCCWVTAVQEREGSVDCGACHRRHGVKCLQQMIEFRGRPWLTPFTADEMEAVELLGKAAYARGIAVIYESRAKNYHATR